MKRNQLRAKSTNYKLRKTLAILCFISFTAAIIYGCKKTELLTDKTELAAKPFTKEDAKEWYYGVFKKSNEYKNYDVKTNGGKNPVWNVSFYKKIGDYEIIEMPISRSQTEILIPTNDKITREQQKRVFQASLTKILFIKKGNIITVRELTFVPEYEYLSQKNFDISNNNFYSLDKNFKGNILISNWKEDFLNGYKIVDGKFSKRISFEKTDKNQLSRTWTTVQTQYSNGCLRQKTQYWKETCTTMIIGAVNGDGDDYTYTNCEEELESESEWEILYCDIQPGECDDPALTAAECLCQQFGGSFCDTENPNPNPNPDPEPNDGECKDVTEASADEYLNYVKSLPSNPILLGGGLTIEANMDVNGLQKINHEYKVNVYDFHYVGNYWDAKEKWNAIYDGKWILNDKKPKGKKVTFDITEPKMVEFNKMDNEISSPTICVHFNVEHVSTNVINQANDLRSVRIQSAFNAGNRITCHGGVIKLGTYRLEIYQTLPIEDGYENK